MSPPSVRHRPAETGPPTAERLLPAAAALFRSKGFAAATTRELSDILGITKASLYHHVRSKEDLLYAICLESLRHMHTEAAATGEAASEDRLRAMIESHVRCMLEERDMHAVMLLELRQLSSGRRAEIIERRDEYEALLRHAIEVDQGAGRLRVDYDAKHLTLALLNLLNWTILWYDPQEARSPRELGTFLATMFIDGARQQNASRIELVASDTRAPAV